MTKFILHLELENREEEYYKPLEQWTLYVFLNERDAQGRAAACIVYDLDNEYVDQERLNDYLSLPDDEFWVRSMRISSYDLEIGQISRLCWGNQRTAFQSLETLEIMTAISASGLAQLFTLAPRLKTLVCDSVDVGLVEPNVRLLELDLYGTENKGSLHQYAKAFPSLQYLGCSLAPKEGLLSYIANAPGNPLSSSSNPRQGDLFKNLLQLWCKVKENRVDCRPEIFALFLHKCFPRYTSIDLGSPYPKRGLYGMWARDVATHRRKLGEKEFPQQPGFIKVEADHFLKNQIIGGVADS
jgi:hypothetical protein